MPVLVLERFTAESNTSTSAGGLSTSTKRTQMLTEPSGGLFKIWGCVLIGMREFWSITPTALNNIAQG